MKSGKTILTLILVTLVFIFAIQNATVVEIQFLVWSFSTPRIFLVVVLLAIGFVLGLLLANLTTRRHRRE